MNIFVYGGCVTRDAYSLLRHEHKLAGFVARQSLISATSNPAELPEPELESAFQKRMVKEDFSSSLVPLLEENAAAIDVIIMDTNIERLGVYEVNDQSYITNSNELRKSGVLKLLDQKPRLIPSSDDQYSILYEKAASNLVEHLNRLGLFEKILVLDAPVAKVDNTGEAFTKYIGREPAQVDAELRQRTSILKDTGLHTVQMPPDLAIADVDHKWGRSPLHYIEEATQWVADQIVAHAS